MKKKLINYFFDSVEEYKAVEPYIKLVMVTGFIYLVLTILSKGL